MGVSKKEGHLFDFNEHCLNCGRETHHKVGIEIVEEGRKNRHIQYSREPYRVSECKICGETKKVRMNDGGRR